MANTTFTLSKNEVLDEVAKTTSYTGAKMVGDDEAYNRIFTTDEDREMLERFWNESKNTLCNALKRVLVSEAEAMTENDISIYILTLGLSDAFDIALTNTMSRSLSSFFVMNIIAKWYAFTNKGEAVAYATEAAANLEDFMRKAFYKKKPTRPTY